MFRAQQAASRGAQSLGTLLYLRKGMRGISPKIVRYLAIAKIFPRMFWASPLWWTGSYGVCNPLENEYHKIARWITGLPPSTKISKLLYCAHLPQIDAWLDYITEIYAVRLIFFPSSKDSDQYYTITLYGRNTQVYIGSYHLHQNTLTIVWKIDQDYF
jgi:hypothetical protein